MPALSSNPFASHILPSGASWEHLAQESPPLLTTGTNNPTNLSCVSLDPPITQAILSEIDVSRLEHDLVLRHHLNFDPETQLRINTLAPQAEERRERALEYWHALATEIALWSAHCQRVAACPTSRSSCVLLPRSGPRCVPQGAAQRLPRLFGAVRDILKHSSPSEDWPTIDARLDVGFLMQQLEHGVCNFTSLSDWFGNFLGRFGAPTRDCLLHKMTSAIRLGVENADIDSIVRGLITMFEILQGMKLDATNRSIRNLRLAWVEDTIAFEQNAILRRIADGWDVTGAQTWFGNLLKADEESGSGLWVLVKALTDAVVFYHKNFPPTFTLDYSRLRTLQFDFQALVFQAACKRTLDQTLEFLGWTGKILPRSYTDLFLRVAVLISDQGLQYDYWQKRSPVALEVVRAAYTVCGNRELPTPEDLEFAEDCLRRCCDPKEPIFGAVRTSLALELEDKVSDEVCAVADLTPAQLTRRLLPPKPGFAAQSETEGLVHVAKRISHVAELHWRIWAPILYEQPVCAGGGALGGPSLVEESADGQSSSPSRRTPESGELPRNTAPG